MATKYRNEDKSKPNIIQTKSSTSLDKKLNKAKQVRRDKDKMKNFSVGIYDIDSAFKTFLEKDVKPTVEDDGRFYPVPVMYASPEKWSSAQRDGFMKDENGMMLTPVIVFRRNSLSINTDMMKLKVAEGGEDAYQAFERKYTNVNKYDQFSVLTGEVPKKEFMSVERPDYVNLEYEVIVWCDYMEQVNKVVEQIVFFQGRSFGERYKFVIKGDSSLQSSKMLMSNKHRNWLQARPVTTKLEQKLNTAIAISYIATSYKQNATKLQNSSKYVKTKNNK